MPALLIKSLATLALRAAAAALALAGPAGATLLSFDWTRDPSTGLVAPTVSPSDIPGDYGDNVAGPLVAVPGGSFLYTAGAEGYTPNVTVDITAGGATATDPHARLWAQGFGDLQNVVYGLPNSQALTIRLSADAGFEAALLGFDLAGYPGTDWVIHAVQVLDGTSLLFEQTDVLVLGAGSGVRHTAFEFASPLVAAELLLRIDYSNLAPSRQDNIGLDNLRFAQLAPSAVPEPATPWLMAMGLMLGLARRCRAGRWLRR